MLGVLAQDGGVGGAVLGPAGFVVAFFVGVIGFFSPCVLPLLPGYLSYVSGLNGEEIEQARARKRVLVGTSLFVLGFAVMFSAFGAAASVVGEYLGTNELVINRIAGGFVILMGLAFLLPGLVPVLERERRPFLSRVRPGVGGAFPLGVAFAVGWTPCVGPGLGAMLSLGYIEGSAWRAAALLFCFSLGFGVWFVLAGLGMRRAMNAASWMRRHARAIQATGGLFMIAIGVLLVTDRWASLMSPLRRLINNFAPPV